MSVTDPLSNSAHIDTFARDNLPPPDQWPVLQFSLPELQYPKKMNCAGVLLDEAITEGHAERTAIYSDVGSLSFLQLQELSNRIANVLVHEQGVVPGNRVLLRGANSLMLCAAWLAVMKAGAIAVTTMPMLRAKELGQIAEKARIDHVLCDSRLLAEVTLTAQQSSHFSKALTWGDGTLETAMGRHPATFCNVDTSASDVCLLAFTSGTTGSPKATMHFHRDVLAMCDTVARHLLETAPDDIYVGSPPLGFTFGLGALLAFPLRFRAASVMIEQPSARALLEAVQRYRATCLFTAPTMYKNMTPLVGEYNLSSLRRSVSAGEALPRATSDAWHAASGIRLIDGLGSTEMIHIFISAKGEAIRPGATGKPLPGYEAVVINEHGRALPAGHSGLLAVRGPTGCRYLADIRQRDYVINGWNVTGDRYHMDVDGYFWFEARADDMIISSGYNIAGPEVEALLIGHPAVREVAVVGAPDAERGEIVKAFIVLEQTYSASPELVKTLQDYVKTNVAPYKYPRSIEFVASLPKGPTGKVQRFVLRQQERARNSALR
jgi:2-aminobenzoate-CoA ligase